MKTGAKVTVRREGVLGRVSINVSFLIVDKVLIAQESLGSLLNTLLPGSYRHVTRIDLNSLDSKSIKTVGIYGSKSEIARFLLEMRAVDADTCAVFILPKTYMSANHMYWDRSGLLLIPETIEGESVPRLRSGLYLFACNLEDAQPPPPAFYIIYWPEETTWDDSADDRIRRNCVTFMRYLTQLADEVRLLISPEHESKLVWGDECVEDGTVASDHDFSDSDGDSDRFVQYQVAKTSEEEEDVQVDEGFLVCPIILILQDHWINWVHIHLAEERDHRSPDGPRCFKPSHADVISTSRSGSSCVYNFRDIRSPYTEQSHQRNQERNTNPIRASVSQPTAPFLRVDRSALTRISENPSAPSCWRIMSTKGPWLHFSSSAL